MIPLILPDIAEGKYEIEEDGRIYSHHIHDYMKPRKDKDGYLRISLRTPDGNIKTWRIATLVLSSFYGSPPITMMHPSVNHIDGNKLNNHISNLEWLEVATNTSIRKNKCTGTKNGQSKLTEEQVKQICELLVNTNLSLKTISSQFNVGTSAISAIKNKKTYKAITNNYDFSNRITIRNELGRYETICLNGGGK